MGEDAAYWKSRALAAEADSSFSLRDQGSSSGKQSLTRPFISSIDRSQRWQVWSPGPIESCGFPFSGKVIRKNLAVCGSLDWALAKPFNCDAVEVMMAFRVWFGDDPSEANPIY